jgi:hypothetical protein
MSLIDLIKDLFKAKLSLKVNLIKIKKNSLNKILTCLGYFVGFLIFLAWSDRERRI